MGNVSRDLAAHLWDLIERTGVVWVYMPWSTSDAATVVSSRASSYPAHQTHDIINRPYTVFRLLRAYSFEAKTDYNHD